MACFSRCPTKHHNYFLDSSQLEGHNIFVAIFCRFETSIPNDWSLYYRGDEKVRCREQIEHAIFVRHRAHFCSGLRCNVIVVFFSITEVTFYIIIPGPYYIAITTQYPLARDDEWRWLWNSELRQHHGKLLSNLEYLRCWCIPKS